MFSLWFSVQPQVSGVCREGDAAAPGRVEGLVLPGEAGLLPVGSH